MNSCERSPRSYSRLFYSSRRSCSRSRASWPWLSKESSPSQTSPTQVTKILSLTFSILKFRLDFCKKLSHLFKPMSEFLIKTADCFLVSLNYIMSCLFNAKFSRLLPYKYDYFTIFKNQIKGHFPA